MKIMMLGDVIGETGLMILEESLSALITEQSVDFTVVNGENAVGGFGLNQETLDRILAAGADAVTGGNHIWEDRNFWPVLDSDKPVLRPANYPDVKGAVPGHGSLLLEKNGLSVLVINLQGREKMTLIDCPFNCFDIITAVHPKAVPVIVDFHAESTEEKEALGYYLDGRASIVAGTHTHVQTADERILPRGTAYITDLGMTGAMNGVIGMDKDICLNRARSQVARRMECAKPRSKEDCAVQGIVVELDKKGRALSVKRLGLHP
ncbi:MAG: YmdB family metallophosphoesterase [Treponema sp.]|jgi:metallophosphoesterase (TIGR00282 family)|nr:YmdB family metallophosphoesterase [Treponema sp.]